MENNRLYWQKGRLNMQGACINCKNGIKISVNEDVLCRIKGAVSKDYFCRHYKKFPDYINNYYYEIKKEEVRIYCNSCTYYSIADKTDPSYEKSGNNSQNDEPGFCNLFYISRRKGNSHRICSRFKENCN